MIYEVAGFGCSWIAGDEIEHPTAAPNSPEHIAYREQNCTLGKLAEHVGAKRVYNFGISGGSLQSTQWEFFRWVKIHLSSRPDPSQTLIVVGLTEASRQSWFTNDKKSRYMHSHWVHPGDTWEDFYKFYTVNADNHNLWATNYWFTTNFFHSYCNTHGLRLLQFNVFPPPIASKHLLHPNWNARDFMWKHNNEQNQSLLAEHKHPNEKGSKFLAERLYKMCNDAKILA